MKIPQEFKHLALRMHTDIDLVLPPDGDPFDYLLRGVTLPERPIAAEFIDALLASNLSDEELVTAWIDAGAAVAACEDDIVSFLRELRDRLRRQ
jgi:hypothetical protein